MLLEGKLIVHEDDDYLCIYILIVWNILYYIINRYDGASRQCLSSVERYDAELDSWTTVAEMSARRSGAGVGVLENVLYAVGGS